MLSRVVGAFSRSEKCDLNETQYSVALRSYSRDIPTVKRLSVRLRSNTAVSHETSYALIICSETLTTADIIERDLKNGLQTWHLSLEGIFPNTHIPMQATCPSIHEVIHGSYKQWNSRHISLTEMPRNVSCFFNFLKDSPEREINNKYSMHEVSNNEFSYRFLLHFSVTIMLPGELKSQIFTTMIY